MNVCVYECVFVLPDMGSTASKAHAKPRKAPPSRRKKKRKVCVYVCTAVLSSAAAALLSLHHCCSVRVGTYSPQKSGIKLCNTLIVLAAASQSELQKQNMTVPHTDHE